MYYGLTFNTILLKDYHILSKSTISHLIVGKTCQSWLPLKTLPLNFASQLEVKVTKCNLC